MTPAWMQPPNDVDRWLKHGDRSGYYPRERDTMTTHAQRIAEIEEDFQNAADEATHDRALHARIAALEASIATLERQVARLLDANPRAALPGDYAVEVSPRAIP